MDAIVVDNVSKKFRIPHEKRNTVFQNIIGVIKGQFSYEEFWALDRVSFEVQRGETIGVIGPNGSGKTTLLKILAGVLYADHGSISVNGRASSFLDLGAGFQSELSAKDNVFLYSSILGVSRRETRKRYDDIFDFAELRKFENMKLKNFSSGMYMRLAFSTAIHADPENLLIDEAFAVGDESFQKKCISKINEFRQQGKTIVFVSHSMQSVKDICHRSLLLRNGHLVSIGETEKVINDYLSASHS